MLYINGIIPLPAKSQLYAMYDKYGGDGIIFSAKLRSKYKMAEFDSAVNEDTPKITLEGRLMTIDNDAFGYLEQVCGDLLCHRYHKFTDRVGADVSFYHGAGRVLLSHVF